MAAGKRGKRADTSPHRNRYWMNGKLVVNKCLRMARNMKCTPQEAYKIWSEKRERHKNKFHTPQWLTTG